MKKKISGFLSKSMDTESDLQLSELRITHEEKSSLLLSNEVIFRISNKNLF